MRTGHGDGRRGDALANPAPFIGRKEERSVLLDRPAKRAAKLVLIELRLVARKAFRAAAVRQYSLALSTLLRKNSYTLPCRSLVPDLVTTLTTEPELRPYSASKVLVRTRNSCNAVRRWLNRRQVGEQIVGVAAIDAEIVGAPAATIHRNRTRAVASVNERIARPNCRHHARLQLQKLISVARVERQVRHLPVVHHRAQLRAGGIDQRRFRSHFDRLFRLANLQDRVEVTTWFRFDHDSLADVRLESRQIEGERVGADRNLGEAVVAAVVGRGLAADARGFVGERDLALPPARRRWSRLRGRGCVRRCPGQTEAWSRSGTGSRSASPR